MGVVDIVLDGQFGSSGKGKLSTWLAAHKQYSAISSANYPNAGHSAVLDDGTKFVAKALPTATILYRTRAHACDYFITPGSGFSWEQLAKEWEECGMPYIFIHERACVVTDEHQARERSGAESTAHLASTMQGTAAALADKIQRKQGVRLAGHYDLGEVASQLFHANETWEETFCERVEVLSAVDFRDILHQDLYHGNILHEGSQGYALSIDHGQSYPYCTSRNCTTAAALDYLGVAPQRLGDVWLNLRTYPIRVGNIAEGSSGDFYSDSEELTWGEVARRAGMPAGEAAALAERERTTVTRRIRRVSTFSYQNLEDAVRTNGATKLSLNFCQYLSWSDRGVTRWKDLSKTTRDFAYDIEDRVGVPVVLLGTGAKQSEMVVREEFL